MALLCTPPSSISACVEHYQSLAQEYDRFYEAQSRARADFIRKFLPLTQDDQVVDIGGGTAQVSLMLKEDLKMTNPVVCVDPSPEMLEVARRNGAITVQSTAEHFLATKPPYPLKVVLIVCCVHHFEDPDFVFTNLAKHMPNNGVCFLLGYPPNTTLPWLKKAALAFKTVGNRLYDIKTLAESKGLKCRLHGVRCGACRDGQGIVVRGHQEEMLLSSFTVY